MAGPGQVLVRVWCCAICGMDVHAYMYDTARPGTVMGHEYCGTTPALGEGVTGWSEGDSVVGGGGIAPAVRLGASAVVLGGGPIGLFPAQASRADDASKRMCSSISGHEGVGMTLDDYGVWPRNHPSPKLPRQRSSSKLPMQEGGVSPDNNEIVLTEVVAVDILTVWAHEAGIIMRDGKITDVFQEGRRSIPRRFFGGDEIRTFRAYMSPFDLVYWLNDPEDSSKPDQGIVLDSPVLTSDRRPVTGSIGITFSVIPDMADLLLRLLGPRNTPSRGPS